jgi:hypothetical protein
MTHPLQAFWHRSRKCYVPLTTEEWARRAKVSRSEQRSLERQGFTAEERTSGHGGRADDVICEITPAGIAWLERQTCKPPPKTV